MKNYCPYCGGEMAKKVTRSQQPGFFPDQFWIGCWNEDCAGPKFCRPTAGAAEGDWQEFVIETEKILGEIAWYVDHYPATLRMLFDKASWRKAVTND